MARILREKDLRVMTGLSRSTLWRLEKANRFPKRVKLGKYSVGWRESEVKKWINSLAAKKAPVVEKNDPIDISVVIMKISSCDLSVKEFRYVLGKLIGKV